MATAPPAPVPKKLSFAKVVAAHPSLPHYPRVAVPAVDRRAQPPAAVPLASSHRQTYESTATMAQPLPSIALASGAETTAAAITNSIVQGVKDLVVSSDPAVISTPPSLVVNGSSSSLVESPDKNDNGASLSDVVSQPADSSSEMGAKAPSLDGKSITSGTTFALDEKESLRPDDSASVKAAADDDEAFSVKGSLLATSRMGSDIRVHRLRIGDMPEKRISVQTAPEIRDQGIATPQSGASSQQPDPNQIQGIGGANVSSDVFNSMYGKNPDDKLLEAMKSPKDRLFLLRLEQDVINFVQSSKEPYMDLPPNNSFCRMLTHKLADYYHMTHSFEAVQGAVRIYRTPFCRVPPSLASIMESEADEPVSTPPPVIMPKKIMRRGEDDGSGQVSTSASKATSEVGSDGKEKAAINKEKMTREEREEAYKRTRERIFGSSSEKINEAGIDNDDANGVSRASSVSGKEKGNNAKKGKTSRHRRDDSDNFPTRSHYVQYFHPQAQVEWSRHAMPTNMPYNGQPPQMHQNQMPQPYPAPPHGYAYPSYGYAPAYATQGQPQPQPQPPPQPQMQPHPPAQPVSWYPSPNGPMSGYGPTGQPVPQQQWQPAFNQTPPPAPVSYQNRGSQSQSQGSPGTIGGIPYAYGQLPVNANPHDPKSQHPIPGSYNRHAFNPKIQSFVPGNGMNPGQPSMGSYNMPAPTHGSPQVGSPHLAYNGFSTPAAPPQQYMGGGPGYGMSRQGSNNSLPPHPSALLLPMPNRVGMGSQAPPTGPSQGYSHLPNYGNPATLPQKPPSGL
ncbi:hypothetical protein F5Y16DRAFT_242414 [Xylariaceae sp. FL0255]|nr:hypothetical protein F5Y16DRAFT_242414 [Xylariaceae sp. FL0255]